MKVTFVASVREGLHAVWVDECLYAGHSVPIGATTTAVEVGMENSLTQKLSRWSSAAFVQTPPAQFVAAARQLFRGNRP